MNRLKYNTIAVGIPGSKARFEALFQDLLYSVKGEWLKPDLSNLDTEYMQEIARDHKGQQISINGTFLVKSDGERLSIQQLHIDGKPMFPFPGPIRRGR